MSNLPPNPKKRQAPSSSASGPSKKAKTSAPSKGPNPAGGKKPNGSGPASATSNKKSSSNTSTPAANNRKERQKGDVARKKLEDQEKKRKLPITGSWKPEVENENDNDVGDDEEEKDVDMDAGMKAANGKAAASKGKGPAKGIHPDGLIDPAEYNKMTKAQKATLHASSPHRSTLLPSHPLLRDTLLPLWEKARQTELEGGPEERRKVVAELWAAVKGRVGEVRGGHKGGRVLQTIVKYGTKEERLGVAEELRGSYEEMMKSTYSKFLVSKLIRFLPSIRPHIILEILSSIPSLLLHANAIQPLSDFYDVYANGNEKKWMVRGFWPKEVLVFEGEGVKKRGGGQGQGEEEKVLGEVGGLEEILARWQEVPKENAKEDEIKAVDARNLARNQRILEELKGNIFAVFSQTQKAALTQALFHRPVLEYLRCVLRFLPEELADKMMHEFLDETLESLPDIVHTKDGAAIVRELLARGVARDRRNILRPFKKHMQKVCEDAEAQTVIFTAFDVVDDTKMMGKDVIGSIEPIAYELAMHKTGRKVLYYLLAPRSKRYFTHDGNQLQAETDVTAAKTSKKDKDVRRRELRDAAIPGLLEMVEEHAVELLRDSGASLLVNEIMLNHAGGDKATAAAAAVLSPLGEPYPFPAPLDSNPDPENAHILDLGHVARIYKTLLSGGHFNNETRKVEVENPDFTLALAQSFWDKIISDEAGGEENAFHIAVGNAPFTLVEMIAALKKDPARRASVRNVLQTPERLDAISKSVRKGSDVLYGVVAAL